MPSPEETTYYPDGSQYSGKYYPQTEINPASVEDAGHQYGSSEPITFGAVDGGEPVSSGSREEGGGTDSIWIPYTPGKPKKRGGKRQTGSSENKVTFKPYTPNEKPRVYNRKSKKEDSKRKKSSLS